MSLRSRYLAGLLTLAPLAPQILVPSPVRALELRGQTYFASPPWKVVARNYFWYIQQYGAEYYFTVDMPEKAGVPLGALRIEQTRGVDRTFQFQVGKTRAFLGEPRAEGPAVPVQVTYDDRLRRFDVRFEKPVAPGEQVTVVLVPDYNPVYADTYLFGVTAYPAGPNPVGQFVGFGTLQILDVSSSYGN